MDIYTVIGIRDIDFVAEDGRNIKGISVYYTYETFGVDGVATDKVFISERLLAEKTVEVGDFIRVFFTRKGTVSGFEIVGDIDVWL